MPFEIGNQHGAKARFFEANLRRAIKADNGRRVRAAAEKLLDMAAEGVPFALTMLADRLDGKARASVEVRSVRDLGDLTLEELQAQVRSLLAGEAADIEHVDVPVPRYLESAVPP
jgi:hypothetical protein